MMSAARATPPKPPAIAAKARIPSAVVRSARVCMAISSGLVALQGDRSTSAATRRSEIGLVGLRDRGQLRSMARAVIAGVEIVVSRTLGAQAVAFGEQPARVPARKALNGVPRRREGARILDVDIRHQGLTAVDHMEALDHMQL